MELFNHSEEELVSFYHSLPETSPEKQLTPYPKPMEPCTLCLGILQESTERKEPLYRAQLRDALKNCQHQYKNFQFCLTLPFISIVREMALIKQLQQELGIELDQSNIPSVKEVFKWLSGLSMPVPFKRESKFTISLSFSHPESENELSVLKSIPQKKSRKQRFQKNYVPKVTYTIPSLMKQMNEKSVEEVKRLGILPLKKSKEFSLLDITFEYGHVYVAGRYNKYSRTLSQTPWVIDGVRRGDGSVEEFISEKIIKLYSADGVGASFSSAGREDIDVRMLGGGRPFLLEIHNPRNPYVTNEQLAQVEKQINGSTTLVQARDLQKIKKAECNKLKEGEEHKKKTYRCVVYINEVLTSEKIKILDELKGREFELQQETPIRVLHRRTLSTRTKTIYGFDYQVINPQFLIVDLETQAGTYIKEFIHGDLGRTNPNLGSILKCEADILQLDVLSIVFDWPPTLQRNE